MPTPFLQLYTRQLRRQFMTQTLKMEAVATNSPVVTVILRPRPVDVGAQVRHLTVRHTGRIVAYTRVCDMTTT